MNRIPCPQCRNALIKPQANAEGWVRCTNCEHRFRLEGPAETAHQAEGARAAAPPHPLSHPPQPAGYGAAALTAYALCLLLTIGALLQLLFVVPNMIEFALPTSDGVPLFLAYLGVIAVEPLLGLLFVLAARSLQRSDGAATEVAWRTGALDQALGPAKGSDLPYILPWMAGGALIVMGAIVASESSPAGFAAVIPAVLFGLVLFFIGLAFADLRRYCWRMRSIGQKLSGHAHRHDRLAGIPILMSIALASTGFGLLVLTARERGTGGLLFFLFDLMVLGIGVAFLLLGLRVDDMSGAWSSVGGRASSVERARASVPEPSVLVTLMPIGGGVWGLVSVCALFASVRGYWEVEVTAFFLVLVGLALFISALACLLNRIETVARHSEQMATALGVRDAETSRFVPAGRFPLLFYAVIGLSTASWVCTVAVMDEGPEGVLVVAMSAVPCFLAHLLALVTAQLLRISRNLEAAARAVAGETYATRQVQDTSQLSPNPSQ